MNLQRMSHFLAVVEAGSMGRAAKMVSLTQPALSKSIQKLEDQLGFSLFDRMGGSLTLTPLGSEYRNRAYALATHALEMEREMEHLRAGRIGVIKVYCGATVAETEMPAALSRLVNNHPEVHVEVQVGDIKDMPDLLRSRQIDFGVGEYINVLDQADLATIPLKPQEIVFVCRSGHPLTESRRRRIATADFFSYPLVATGLPTWAAQWLREHHPDHSRKELLSVRCNHYPLLKSILLQSNAVSGVPEGVVRTELEAGTMVKLALDAPALVNRPGILHLRNRQLSPAAQNLIAVLTG